MPPFNLICMCHDKMSENIIPEIAHCVTQFPMEIPQKSSFPGATLSVLLTRMKLRNPTILTAWVYA